MPATADLTLEQPRRGTSRASLAIIALVVVAALLRLWSISGGIAFSVAADEPAVMQRAVHIIKTGDFNPHFFDYPSLYLYLEAAVAAARFVSGAMRGEWAVLAQAPVSAFYLWARILTALMGTATVYLVYCCAREWDEWTGWLAAAFAAIMPIHVRESHFALTDVPATFFVALTWYFTVRDYRRFASARFVLAGVAAGLAAATKYNAGFAIVLPLAACAIARKPEIPRLRAAAIVCVAAAAAFIVAAPYTLLDLPAFLNGFGHLAAAYRGRPPEAPAITYAKHLRIALGWPACLVTVSGAVIAALQLFRADERIKWALPIVFPLAYFAFIADQGLVFARYLMPVIPFLGVLAALTIVTVHATLTTRLSRRPATATAVALAAATLLPGAVTSIRFDQEMSKAWTSELAYRWFLDNVPPGAKVVIESGNLTLFDRYRATNVPELRAQTLETYEAEGVEYLVASSQSFGHCFDAPSVAPGACADYQRLLRGTVELARFVPSTTHPGSELRILKVPRS